MSDWTIWGYEAHLVLEVDGRMIEILEPMKEGPKGPELDFKKILDTAEESRRSQPPAFREVTFDA